MIANKGYKHFLNGLIITLIVISLGFIAVKDVQEFFQRIEGILYDIRLLATLPETPRKFDENVIIIDIDEKSLAEQGRYPWSRSKISQLVDNLMASGVVVVAFDIVFPEPEDNPVDLIIANNHDLNSPFVEKITSLKPSVDADLKLSNAITNAEVVLGMMFDDEKTTNSPDITDSQDIEQTENLSSNIVWEFPKNAVSDIAQFNKVLKNIDVLNKNASGSGFINSVPESDGFIRKASLVIQYQGKLYPSLALEAARVYTLSDQINTESELNNNHYWLQSLSFGEHKIPTNEKGQILIPFKGAQKSFTYISATDVIENRVPTEKLEGAVAFIGTSAIGLADLRATSVGIQYPGVEVHANVFEGLMHPEIIPVEPDTTLAIQFILLFITGLVLSFLMNNQGPMRIFYICFAALFTHLALNWSLWFFFKVSLPQSQILLIIIWLTLYFGSVGFFLENYRRKHIKGVFDQYVPPAYIDKLLATGKGISLTPERRVMSVLFADIRDFTQLSENFSPDELSEFINEYLSENTRIIFEKQGTIDKYVGDMVMAFWNAPLDDEQHEVHAVDTALAMIATTQAMSKKFKTRGWPAINIGVGVSTGDMIVGDMGSTYRKAYTVLGDEVNLGSRIESLTKFYGVSILISEQTYQAVVKQGMLCRQVDTIRVKGKQKPTTIYEPIGAKEQQSKEMCLTVEKHHEGIQAYLAQEWDTAINIFTELQNQRLLSSKLYDIYINRIAELKQSTLNNEWDGTYSHLTK
ncbi:adenylate/guanylate cyclase domain-containing protein [Colwellia sp. 1_MG-2023]|uniref:CHASE2 domain-containing protein n=1 Tax=Colwellia sp. 1_MG-2023 TaxID=3062649 RepID=UPI0026E46BAC|nr:adenylate/guanylate cyclase domain-containing protein [Colwellia sp. 1_MG-2023]MDO6447057.1 adenylate/guanylate cyclase domain-containing protein [Colwellia sp. 1_MG-2023]